MSTLSPHSSFSAWFSALTGNVAGNSAATAAGAAEGQFMRQLLAARAKATMPPLQQPSVDMLDAIDRAWENIKTRAQLEGLFGSQATPQATASTPSRSAANAFAGWRFGGVPSAFAANQSKYALAASIAVLVIGLGALMRTIPTLNPPDEVVMRGEEQAQRISTANPEQLANQIERILQENKYPYSRKNLTSPANAIQIQAKLPPIANPAAAPSPASAALKALSVQVPEHGRLNIVLMP